jgi:hypothetical protein
MTRLSSNRIKALAVGAAITCMLGGGVGVANASQGADDAPGHLQHTGLDDGARNSTDDNPTVTKPATVPTKTTVAKKTVVVAKAKPAAAQRSNDDGPTHHSSGVEDSATHQSRGAHHGAGTDDSSVSHRRGRAVSGSTASRSTDDSTISGKNRVSDDSPDSPDDSDISGKGGSKDD